MTIVLLNIWCCLIANCLIMAGNTTQSSADDGSVKDGINISVNAIIVIVVFSVLIVWMLFTAIVIILCCKKRPSPLKSDEPVTDLEKGPQRLSTRKDAGYLNIEVRPSSSVRHQAVVTRDYENILTFNVLDALETALRSAVQEYTIDENRLHLEEVIGGGRFGVVYRATLTDEKNTTSKTVAVKTIRGESVTQEEVTDFLKEVMRMKQFSHQNVLTLRGIAIKDSIPHIILPYMENGDLKTYIGNPKHEFVLLDLLTMAVQVADGMAYLEARRYIHRDLAARNCVVDINRVVKVADFGLSRDIYNYDYYRLTHDGIYLPVRWMAVESLNEKIFTTKSDVWSYGVLVWEVMTRGLTPYEQIENSTDVVEYVLNGGRLSKPSYCPEKFFEYMSQCWDAEPDRRPSFRQLADTIHDELSY